MTSTRTRLVSALTTVVLALTATACSGGGDGGGGEEGDAPGDATTSDAASQPTEHTGREGDGWTVLVYSMADNDLETFLATDVNEMGEVGSNDNLQIRTLMDRSAEYVADPVLDQGDWQGTRVFDLADPGTTELVADLGDIDSADPATLADFVAQGFSDHRAGNYALIISDHGASWPGMGPDEGTGNNLDLTELADSIRSGLDQAGIDKLDLLGFDACLMASYEVASAMAPLADRMVASQEKEPGHGWDYRSLQVLADNPEATADELGSEIIDGFLGQATDEGEQDGITLSMVDLTQMEVVDDAVAAFATSLADGGAEVAPVVGRVEAQTLAFGRSPDPAQDFQLTDLGVMATGIAEAAPEVAAPAEALAAALDAAVLDQVEGAAYQGASGLSIYFPPTVELSNADYESIPGDGAWLSFLVDYYDIGAELATDEVPQFVDDDGLADVEFDGDGFSISASYDEALAGNITSALIQYAIVEDDGSLTYLGEESAVISPDAPLIAGFYDGTVLAIDDGEDTVFAYTQLDYGLEGLEQTGPAYLTVPLTYYAADDVDQEFPQELVLELTIDGGISNATYYVVDAEAGVVGELAPDPDGLIFPKLPNVTDAGVTWSTSSDVGLYADTEFLTYEFLPLDSGTTVQLDASITDFAGNTSVISNQTQVP